MLDHSPAPWSADPEGEVAYTIEDALGVPICDVYIGTEHDEGNERLIVASPELYEALRGLVKEVGRLKLDVRKDFSLMNQHACATKILHEIEKPPC